MAGEKVIFEIAPDDLSMPMPFRDVLLAMQTQNMRLCALGLVKSNTGAVHVLTDIGDAAMLPVIGNITAAYVAELRRLTHSKKPIVFTTLLFLKKESAGQQLIFCNIDDPGSSPAAIIQYESLAVAHFEGALSVHKFRSGKHADRSSVAQPALQMDSIADVRKWLDTHCRSAHSEELQRLREAVNILEHPKPTTRDIRKLQRPSNWNIAGKVAKKKGCTQTSLRISSARLLKLLAH